MDDQNNRINRKVGSGFVNMQRIIDANKQNRLGSQIQSGIRSVAGDTRTQAEKQEQQFKTEAEKNRLDTEANKQQREQIITQAASGTEASDEQKTLFDRLKEGGYKGPTGLQNATQLQQQAEQTESLGRGAFDASRRQGLLQRFVGGKNYSAGQLNLDNALLAQQKGDLQNIRRAGQGVVQNVAQRQLAAQNVAQEYQNRAKAFGEETAKKLETEQGTISSELQTKIDAAKAADAERQKLASDIAEIAGGRAPTTHTTYTEDGITKTFAPSTDAYAQQKAVTTLARQKGLMSEADYNRYVNLYHRAEAMGPDSLNKFFKEFVNSVKTEDASANTLSGVADASQAARYNALAKLGGKEVLNKDTQGKYTAGRQYFDFDALDQSLTSQEAAKYKTALPAGYTPSSTGERPSFIQTAVQAATNPVGAVTSVFCLFEGSMIEMTDGSFKPVEQLCLGDDTLLGGMVTGVGQTLTESIVEYRGVRMSPRHAVFDDGVWLRAGDHAETVTASSGLPYTIVYPIVTENHLLVCNDNVLADFAETDQGTTVTDDDRLWLLNQQEDRNRLLQEFQNGRTTLRQRASLRADSSTVEQLEVGITAQTGSTK